MKFFVSFFIVFVAIALCSFVDGRFAKEQPQGLVPRKTVHSNEDSGTHQLERKLSNGTHHLQDQKAVGHDDDHHGADDHDNDHPSDNDDGPDHDHDHDDHDDDNDHDHDHDGGDDNDDGSGYSHGHSGHDDDSVKMQRNFSDQLPKGPTCPLGLRCA